MAAHAFGQPGVREPGHKLHAQQDVDHADHAGSTRRQHGDEGGDGNHEEQQPETALRHAVQHLADCYKAVLIRVERGTEDGAELLGLDGCSHGLSGSDLSACDCGRLFLPNFLFSTHRGGGWLRGCARRIPLRRHRLAWRPGE